MAAPVLPVTGSVAPVGREAPFVHISTAKVYDDAANQLSVVELKPRWEYADQARAGDDICYCSGLRWMMDDYPGWKPEISLARTFDEIVMARNAGRSASPSPG